MSRKNFPKKFQKPQKNSEESEDENLFGGLTQMPKSVEKRGSLWEVRKIPQLRALKVYVCPACVNPIPVGVAHLVVWKTEGILGDRWEKENRRHWHEHCWRIF